MSTLAEFQEAIRGKATHEEAEDVLALLLLGDPSSVQAEGRAVMARFAARAGIDPSFNSAALETAVESYLRKHPLNPSVVGALKTVAEGWVAQKGPRSADVDAAFSLLGQMPSKTPIGGGPRPEGTVPAGPLARFTLDSKQNK